MELIKKITEHRKYTIILITTIIILSVMRLLFINADAPQDISISAAIFTDEGFKTFAARNMLLFGDWQWTPEDQYANWFLQSPLGTLSYVLVFTLFGVGFGAIRGLSIAYSIATIILLYVFIKRNYDKETAYISLILYGINYFNIISGRMGFFETHLNFYIVLTLISITELFKFLKSKKYLISAILAILSIICITTQYFLKKNFLIIPVSLIPALIIVIFRNKNYSSIALKRILSTILIAAIILYTLLGHLGSYQTLFNNIMSLQIFGYPLGQLIPLRLFDPITSVVGKGLYTEFIFLQPLTFAVGMVYSIYVFNYYIDSKRVPALDLFSASWLLFTFIMLSVMAYHPSRYYQLCSIPLAICAARAIMEINRGNFKEYFTSQKPFPFNLMYLLLLVTMIIYSFIILYVQLLPFPIRSDIMRTLYPAFADGPISSVFHIIIPIIIMSLILIVFLIIHRKRILNFLATGNKSSVVLTAIIILQLFQFGKWMAGHDYTLYEASVALGKELPENSVIVGSWSSGLSIENNLRPVIIQSGESYNHATVLKLVRGEPLQTIKRNDNDVITSQESGAPVYFAVSRNVIFERPILKKFGHLLKQDQLIKKLTLGYFDVEIYKVPIQPTDGNSQI